MDCLPLGKPTQRLKLANTSTASNDLPFAGYDTVLAGDIAQLPPPGSVSLYTLN